MSMSSSDRKLRTTRLDDWREVAGVAMPFHLHEDNGDPNDAVDLKIASIERGTPPAFTRPADRAPDMAGTASVPFELLYGGLIYVHVIVRSEAAHDPARRLARGRGRGDAVSPPRGQRRSE